MKKLLMLALAGALVACSDAGGVDPDAIDDAEILAVRTALDSAFLHDTVLDPAFTGDSGLYALMSALVFPFIDRASRIAQGGGRRYHARRRHRVRHRRHAGRHPGHEQSVRGSGLEGIRRHGRDGGFGLLSVGIRACTGQ